MKRFAALSAILLLASCAGGFNREWNQALEAGKGVARQDLDGPWQGTWRSEVSGHQGELRCLVSAVDQAPAETGGPHRGGPVHQTHRFHYHATFMKFLSATYDVTHEVRQRQGRFTFSGDQRLSGTGGGVYHYEGSGTPSGFRATFRSDSDHGVFELRRP